jgi:hypothetical protein
MSEENIDQVNLESESGASSSDVKNDVTPETHYKDEKGVPYYNRFRESEEKLKGFAEVDLDRYGRLKEFDPDEVQEAMEFKNLAYADQEKLAKVLEILKAEKKEAQAESGNQSPDVKALADKIAKLEASLSKRDEAEKKKGQQEWMQKFDSSTDKAIADSLKVEAFKELGGKLSEFEKNSLKMLVDKVYEADAQGKKSLGIDHVPKVVEGVLKLVLENRKGTAGTLKKDESPQPINGTGNTGEKKKAPMDDAERVADGIKFLQESRAGRIPG